MGTNSSRRISKKEYEQVDVVEACDFVAQPPQSLALRLSSNLMFGIVRVYGQKCSIYYDDVNSFLGRIRRVAVHEESLLLLAAAETKYEQITIGKPALSSSAAANNGRWFQTVAASASKSALKQFGWLSSGDEQLQQQQSSSSQQNLNRLSLMHTQDSSSNDSMTSFEGGVHLQDPRDITLHNAGGDGSMSSSSMSLNHQSQHGSGGGDDFMMNNPLNIDDLLASGTGDLLFEFEQADRNHHGNAELFVSTNVLMESDDHDIGGMSKHRKKRQFGAVDEADFDNVHLSFEPDNLPEMARENMQPMHGGTADEASDNVARRQQNRKRARRSNQFDNIISMPVRELLCDPKELPQQWFMRDLANRMAFKGSVTVNGMKDYYSNAMKGASVGDLSNVHSKPPPGFDVSAGRPSMPGDYSIEVGRNRGSINSANEQNIISSSSNATYDRQSMNSSDQSSLLQDLDMPIHDGRESNASLLGNMSFNNGLGDEPWQIPMRDDSRISLGAESQSQFTFEINTPLPDLVAQSMDGCIEFKQVLPTTGVDKKNMRKVASKMFFNLLVSLTKNQVDVEQHRPYGPIVIMAKA